MEEYLNLPPGKVLMGTIMGPLKTGKLYMKRKLALRNYEKRTGVTPLSRMNRKMFHSEGTSIDMKKQTRGIAAILFKASANTTDIYYEGDQPVLSCHYQIKQKLMNKDTKIVCNCISSQAKMHSSYYFLAMEQSHNVITDQTESLIAKLNPV